MKRPKRSNPTLPGVIGVAVLVVLGAACGKDPKVETETHFLRSCEGECGQGLSCICGVCTEPCTADRACTQFSTGATCVETADACGSPVASACEMACTNDRACHELGASFSCVAGRCRTSSGGAPRDGGPVMQAGAGGASGTRDGGPSIAGTGGASGGSGSPSLGDAGPVDAGNDAGALSCDTLGATCCDPFPQDGPNYCNGARLTCGADNKCVVNCDCPLGAFFPVCGTDGMSYDATCGRECVPVPIACDGECPCAGGGELHWFESCGDPVCGISPDPSDDPNIPNCTTQQAGDSCSSAGERCDGVLSCGASLVCAATDPKMGPGGCPISRARFKEGIEYLSEEQRHDYHSQVMSLPLASYRYKHAEGAGPQLGFIIEDIEPSVAVSGDHVNMYGYLSMAVAAIQVQQEQIASLQRELDRLRAELPVAAAPFCGL